MTDLAQETTFLSTSSLYYMGTNFPKRSTNTYCGQSVLSSKEL